MYSHCIFCKSALGANERIEHFPTGKKLAFDSARGRLWVICPACSRWNLSPLEERWEAVDECERLFESTPTRTSTENIGLARVPPGLTLVRIGRPMRPEFAAWRYGELFLKRRKRAVVATSASLAVIGGYMVAGPMAGLVWGGGAHVVWQLPNILNLWRSTRPITRIHQPDKAPLVIRRSEVDRSVLSANENAEFTVTMKVGKAEHHFAGPEAERLSALILPYINRNGASRSAVDRAVKDIDRVGGPEALLHDLARQMSERARWSDHKNVAGLPLHERLALEMALHEEQERRALEGELAELEAQWKEAEAIASISDDLLLSKRITNYIERLKTR